MSVMLPHRRSHVAIVGILLVDLPVLLAVLVLGFWLGFRDVYWTITAYRIEHPWTFAPTVALAAVLAWRWWRA